MILGIMGAMPDEVDQLCAKLENVTVEPYGGVEYHKGKYAVRSENVHIVQKGFVPLPEK